ncbi:MAG: helix-turn-helix domain-containing protein [Bacteriovoracaceae bacterium]|nr:helix-turn-helix domain-containing protein [Bacteroidota bacterium]
MTNTQNIQPKEILPSAEERIAWFAEYEKVKKVPLVCKKFGISRKTFYKWWKRYNTEQRSSDSLKNRSRKPHHNPRATPEHIIQRLKSLREQTGFGQKRLQLYLSLWYGIELAENTIWKILRRSGIDMKETKTRRRKVKPHEPLLPGDRVIIFVKAFEKQVGKQKYFYYAAIDECTHLRIARIYARHSTLSALDFVQYILTSFPFSIHYIHTPLDNAFTSIAMSRSRTHAFTQNLRRLGIKQHIPTRKQSQSKLYAERIRQFDSPEAFISFHFNAHIDAERMVNNYLFDYNNNQPRKEIGMMTPLNKLRTFEQFKDIKEFHPKKDTF